MTNTHNHKANPTDNRIIQSLIKPFRVFNKPKCFNHNSLVLLLLLHILVLTSVCQLLQHHAFSVILLIFCEF